MSGILHYHISSFLAFFAELRILETSRRDAAELQEAAFSAAELRGSGQGVPRQRRSPLQDQLRTTAAAAAPETRKEVGRASAGILRGRGHEPQLTAAQLQRVSSVVVKATKRTNSR